LQNITQLVSRTKLNIVAKYHKIGIKNQTKPNCKISHNSSFNKVENITQKQKRINLAKTKCVIMESEGIKS